MLKRAITVAVSGMHHLLMIGPPGSGKSMSARAIRGILPPMTFEESLEVTQLCSVAWHIRARVYACDSAAFSQSPPYNSGKGHDRRRKDCVARGNQFSSQGYFIYGRVGRVSSGSAGNFAPALRGRRYNN